MPSPENPDQLFDTQDLEIFVPAVHRVKPEAPTEPQDTNLFDPNNPGNTDSYQLPPVEAEAESELSYYASHGVSEADEAKINKYLEQGNRSRSQIEKDVLGHAIGEAPPPPARARAKGAEDHHEPKTKRTNRLRLAPRAKETADGGDARSREIKRAQTESDRANALERGETIDNPPQ